MGLVVLLCESGPQHYPLILVRTTALGVSMKYKRWGSLGTAEGYFASARTNSIASLLLYHDLSIDRLLDSFNQVEQVGFSYWYINYPRAFSQPTGPSPSQTLHRLLGDLRPH